MKRGERFVEITHTWEEGQPRVDRKGMEENAASWKKKRRT